MRKKLLSLLTVLCLVLGMLPATAMAAEIADIAAELGYSEEEIANAIYIDEDTDLEEDVEGLVIVVAPVKVTVKGAKLATGILVAPDAKGAVVTLGENADVNAVIVMATAEVVVEETAVASSVTVTAPETTVTVAGEVAVVTVAEEAESTTITVAETATVTTLEVAAPDVTAEVAGTVETVAVAETATGAELVVAETASVATVTDATGELTVSGDGAANVEVTDTSASEEEEDKEEAEEEEGEDEDDAAESFVPDVIIPDTHKANPGFTTAPLVGKDDSTNIPEDDLVKNYSLSVSNAAADNEFRVVIKATGVEKHQATTGGMPEGYWVGLAIPKQGNYSYYLINCKTNNKTENFEPDSTFTDNNGVVYDTFYFNMGIDNRAEDGGVTDFFQLGVLAGENTDPEYVIDIAFDVTLAEDSGNQGGTTGGTTGGTGAEGGTTGGTTGGTGAEGGTTGGTTGGTGAEGGTTGGTTGGTGAEGGTTGGTTGGTGAEGGTTGGTTGGTGAEGGTTGGTTGGAGAEGGTTGGTTGGTGTEGSENP